jgi:hypothetical protein|tara:strand:+ start:3651 stop:3920 length:270 start_codon:yes stop_codon:yes gene_type:complete
MANKKYQKVEVIWFDAVEGGDVGWNDLKEQVKFAKKPSPVMRNVGYEVYRNDDHISLLHSIGDNECSSVEKIPMSCIKKIVSIQEKSNG